MMVRVSLRLNSADFRELKEKRSRIKAQMPWNC